MDSATVHDLQARNGNCKHLLASSPILLVQWESTELHKPIVVFLSLPLSFHLSKSLFFFVLLLIFFLFLSSALSFSLILVLVLSLLLSLSRSLSIYITSNLHLFFLCYCLSLSLYIYYTNYNNICRSCIQLYKNRIIGRWFDFLLRSLSPVPRTPPKPGKSPRCGGSRRRR